MDAGEHAGIAQLAMGCEPDVPIILVEVDLNLVIIRDSSIHDVADVPSVHP